MPRIRTVKPEFWSHPVTGRLSDSEKCMALALLNLADDHGYFYADPALVRSFARPFDDESTTTRRLIDRLAQVGWIEVAIHPSRGEIGRVVGFDDHQSVDRPKPSKIKPFFTPGASTTDRRSIDDASALEQGTGNREQTRSRVVDSSSTDRRLGGPDPEAVARAVAKADRLYGTDGGKVALWVRDASQTWRPDWIEQALDLARANGTKRPESYMAGILRNWAADGGPPAPASGPKLAPAVPSRGAAGWDKPTFRAPRAS